MTKLKIIYWVSTILFAAIFVITGTLYLLRYPDFLNRIIALHYPAYLLDILGPAKILGGIALVVPRFDRLKEWAYAGSTFDFIGIILSHFFVPGLGGYSSIFIPLSLLVVSYISFRRLQFYGVTPRFSGKNFQ